MSVVAATEFSWAELPLDRPIEYELGCGKGLAIRQMAAERPNHLFLGVEVATKYANMAASKAAAAGLDNVRVYKADGVQILCELIPDNSLEAVHVYFPDPWWKARHKKRRVLNERSVVAIERILKPGCSLHFWTDVLDYYESTLELLAELTKLQGPLFVEEKSADDHMDYKTHFERRTRLNGLPVYRSRFVKNP